MQVKLLMIIVSSLMSLTTFGQVLVKDALSGIPVNAASVFDEEGNIIGVTDQNGQLPPLANTISIQITHVAYQTFSTAVRQLKNEILLTPITYSLNELVVTIGNVPFCLRLTCYHRRYMVNAKTTRDYLKPIVCYFDEICYLYIYPHNRRLSHRCKLVGRNVISNEILTNPEEEIIEGLSYISLPERFKNPKNYKTFDSGITQQVFGLKWERGMSFPKEYYVGNVVSDTTSRKVIVNYDALAPKRSRSGKLQVIREDGGFQNIGKVKIVSDQCQAVYTTTDLQQVMQEELQAYSERRHIQGTLKRPGQADYPVNAWLFDEYFTLDTASMTEDECRAETDDKKYPTVRWPMEKMEKILSKANIPLLPEEIQRKITETKEDSLEQLFHEHIYLHTDKPYYAAGDTIWFRAHLLNAEKLQPACLSRFVYVELYDQQADTLCQRVMVKANEDNVFANAILLPKDMHSGTYTLAAYTQWMRNFGAKHFFYKPLAVVNEQNQRLRIPSSLCSKEYPFPSAEVSICAEAKSHKERMDVTVKLDVPDNHSPSGFYSLSITDADVIPPNADMWNIRQYLSHADSVLSGSDNAPIVYPFQTEQLITGCVTGTLKKHLNNPHLLMLSHQEGWRREFELGDSSRFALAVDIPDGYSFTLEGTRHNGSTSLVKLSIDSLSYPRLQPPSYEQQAEIDLSGFVAQSVAQHAAYGNDGIELPEVVATGHKRPLSKRLGMPSFTLTAEDSKLSIVKDMEILLRTIGVKHYIDTHGVPHLNARIFIVSKDKGFVPISVSDILPSEIQQLDFYRGTMSEPDRVVIQIKNRARFHINKKNNMAVVRQLGYLPSVEFYSPQYPLEDKSQYTRSDYRTTLYWNPKLYIDGTGEVDVTFYASDVSKRYLVTLEGVSDDGTVVHQQQVIE